MHNFTEQYAGPDTDVIIKWVLIRVLYRPCLPTQVPVPEKCVSLQTKCNVRERKAFLCLSMRKEHRSSSIYPSSAVVTLFTTMLNSKKTENYYHRVYLCVLRESEKKWRSFYWAKLTTGFL
jgi:hypothetical protein